MSNTNSTDGYKILQKLNRVENMLARMEERLKYFEKIMPQVQDHELRLLNVENHVATCEKTIVDHITVEAKDAATKSGIIWKILTPVLGALSIALIGLIFYFGSMYFPVPEQMQQDNEKTTQVLERVLEKLEALEIDDKQDLP